MTTEENTYEHYFMLHFALVIVYFVYNVIEIIVEGTPEKTIRGIVFLTILFTRLGKPYGKLFIFLGYLTIFADATLVLVEGMDAFGNMGYLGSMFENVWLVCLGGSGYLVNTYIRKTCADCGSHTYEREQDVGWMKYVFKTGKKSKNLLVCDKCQDNEFWIKVKEIKEDESHPLPFKALSDVRKSKWFFPLVEFSGAGVFALYGLWTLAYTFGGLGIMVVVSNKYFHHKKSDFEEGGEKCEPKRTLPD